MSGLTTPLTSLIGREHDVARVAALLGSARLVTLTGPGGVGKTRLALAVVDVVRERFADGVVVVSLAALHDPALVTTAIAQALGLGDHGERPLEQTLMAYLSARQLLLVIDNVEHLLSAAPLLVQLLGASPALSVLLTSRAPVQLAGEHVYQTPPLALPDLRRLPSVDELGHVAAIQLFMERAQEIAPAVALTHANAASIAAICEQLAGLPLAIELAAARLNVLSLSELQRRLDQQLALLTGGTRDQPARHQTMRATIAWSYTLLGEPERRLFREFAVFAGGWTLEAASAVATSGSDVLGSLTVLVASSLAQRGEQSDGVSRFSMLEPIRQFAREQLEEHGEAAEARARHAAFYGALGVAAAQHLTQQDAAAWCDLLEREHSNLRAVLRWASDTGASAAGLELVGNLRDFWFTRGYLSDGIAQATVLLQLPGAETATRDRARALATRAWLAVFHGDYPRAVADGHEALRICARCGDRTVEPFVRNLLGMAYSVANAFDAARTMFAEALDAARAVGDAQTLARVLVNLAGSVADDDAQRATTLLDESIAISRTSGDRDTLALALYAQAAILWSILGQPAALHLLRESLTLYHELGGPWGMVQCLDQFATLALMAGDAEQTVRLYASAAELAARHGIAHGPSEEAARQQDLAQARLQLGSQRFEALWAAQRDVPLDQVLDALLAADAGAQSQPATSPTTRHDALTSRELEVLRLLVEGQSNREIGAALFISHYTVMRHVSNIFDKLGVESRTAAATYAMRHGLT
jgi:predicted ATPase/DNA-binding CsgD family transcriptional regulator